MGSPNNVTANLAKAIAFLNNEKTDSVFSRTANRTMNNTQVYQKMNSIFGEQDYKNSLVEKISNKSGTKRIKKDDKDNIKSCKSMDPINKKIDQIVE